VADLLTTLITTVAVGALYALLALGYTLVYGVLKFINFAHSDIFVLGAWTSFTASTVILSKAQISSDAAPWWLAALVLLAAVLVCATVGYCVERFAYRPLRKAPRLNVLITAIGVSLLLQNLGQLPGAPVATSPDGKSTLATIPFGATPKSMPALIEDRVLNQTAIASGSLLPAERRGQVRLDQDVLLQNQRSYKLVIARPDPAPDAPSGSLRTETLNIVRPGAGQEGEPGQSTTIAKGTDLTTVPRRSPQELAGATFTLVREPTVPIRLIDVIITLFALALMAALQYLVFKTSLGRAMRAISFNPDNAALMGINVNRVISITFVLGSALAAAAAFLYPLKYAGLNQPAHQVWVLLGLKAFVAAVVGGIGNVRGAVMGGFLIAAVEQLGMFYGDKLLLSLGARQGLGTSLGDVYVFTVLILVLLLRPSGILGTTVREKV
jgi:branched-chain amino acid transport system permease protein